MNNYLQYDAVDFAQEQSFVRWIQKSDSQDSIFWEEWTTNHPEKNEEITKAIAIVNQIKFKEGKIAEGVEDKVWSNIKVAVEKETINNIPKTTTLAAPKTSSKLIKMISLAAVAAIAIFFLMINTGSDFDSTIQTQYADVQSVTLPDGSVVQLNSDSKLSYNSKTWDSDRMLELEGEAFFEVKKGSKFIVHTDNGNVAVLGTSFNVYSRSKKFDVYCTTGKVSVTAEKNTTILTPNQSVTVRGKKHDIQKDIMVSDGRANWKEGIYTYKGVSIMEVIKELERQLDLKISISKELKKTQFTGSFTTTDKETALAEVFWPLGLKYENDGKHVIVTNK